MNITRTLTNDSGATVKTDSMATSAEHRSRIRGWRCWDEARGSAAQAGLDERSRILPRLIPLLPGEAAIDTEEGRRRVLRLLARALRSERSRGHAGHWTYDLDRHRALAAAYAAERASRPGRKGGPLRPA